MEVAEEEAKEEEEEEAQEAVLKRLEATIASTTATAASTTSAPAPPPPPTSGAMRFVTSYMDRIKPSDDDLKGNQPLPTSQREHLTSAPKLLNDVIFQELVFGRDLGSGSFSTVRYCKHVQRGQPAVTWPEYAAKVIKAELIKELGYEGAVRREIVVLRQLSHPGISRLVASFRWRDDIYLLLEYAARGDLHGHLRRMGSLAVPNAQFLFAQIAAALKCIHEAGFAYGDLKPENILLTLSGHAKLTDFGAARALEGSEKARKALSQAKYVIMELRDGDWRARQQLASGGVGGVAQAKEEGGMGGGGGGGRRRGGGGMDGWRVLLHTSRPS